MYRSFLQNCQSNALKKRNVSGLTISLSLLYEKMKSILKLESYEIYMITFVVIQKIKKSCTDGKLDITLWLIQNDFERNWLCTRKRNPNYHSFLIEYIINSLFQTKNFKPLWDVFTHTTWWMKQYESISLPYSILKAWVKKSVIRFKPE